VVTTTQTLAEVTTTTNKMMTLRALLEKNPDADVLREMIGFAAERLMELEVGGLTGAGHGERSLERMAQRNGYRDRDWKTRAGQSSWAFPSCARLPSPRLLEPRRMAKKALTAVIQEALHPGARTHP
jgi:transposase-like protein